MNQCLLAAAVLLVAAAPEKPAEAELQKLQGTWHLTSAEVSGRSITAEADYKLVIKGDKATLTMYGRTMTGTIRVDPTLKPKALDFIYEGEEPTPAIYQLDGDVLKICETKSGGMRPTEFTSKGDNGGMVTVYKRAKP